MGGPSCSRDGRIAFHSIKEGNAEIYSMLSEGQNLDRITLNSFADTNTSWSSDGTKIVFQRLEADGSELYVMNTAGAGQTRITSNADDDSNPSW
ncbi:MAG: hypothetical protein EXR59_03530 [Dehalococcoidia bacterium]|nr:hypothetical protein [Dehalococcoidia bacterium]